MTTVATIISDAFRQSNLIPVNGSVTAAQQTEALRYLSRIVKSVLGNEVGEGLTDYNIGDKNIDRKNTDADGSDNIWTVPVNHRLVCNMTQNETVYLPTYPRDGDRVSAID